VEKSEALTNGLRKKCNGQILVRGRHRKPQISTGAFKLRELITRTYRLDEINRGYADLDAGKNLRV